jgi:hypothetical protein
LRTLVENALPQNLFRNVNDAIQLIAALAKGNFTADKIVDNLFCGAISSPAPKKVKLEPALVPTNTTGSPAGTFNEHAVFYVS